MSGPGMTAGVYDWGAALPVLRAERLVLRPTRPGDAEDLYALFSNEDVSRYWSERAWTDPKRAPEYLEQIDRWFRERDGFQWAVALQQDDRLIGTCTLFQLYWKHKRAEIGYALQRPFWGRGLMTEALTALFDFAFRELALHRLEADVEPRNAKSLAILERLGFRREGLLRERFRVEEEVQDSLILGLLRPEWEARRR